MDGVLERKAPASARTVTDLIALVGRDEHVRFSHSVEPVGDEPYFFHLAQLGEYMNIGALQVFYTSSGEPGQEPRPASSRWPEVTIASMSSIEAHFTGDLAHMGDFHHWSQCYVLSERLHDFLAERDTAFESRTLVLADKPRGRIERVKLVRPTRVLDAVDIAKTDVTIANEPIYQGASIYFPRIRFGGEYEKLYGGEYTFRADIPEDVQTFVEEHSRKWLWRHDLLRAVKAAGFHGFYARPTYRRSFLQEIRFDRPKSAR